MSSESSVVTAPKPGTPPQAGLPVGEILDSLARRWWIVAAGFAAGCVVAVGIWLYAPRTFLAEARLLVRYVADTTALDPGAESGRVVMLDARGENVLNSEVEILANQNAVEAVVDRIGAQRFPVGATNGAARMRAVVDVMRNLRIDVPKRSNVIRVSYEGPTPELSVEVLSRLVELYLDRHLRVHRSAAAYDFLAQQTDQNRARLAETEAELRKLKSALGVVSFEEAQKTGSARIEELKRSLGAAEAELAAALARLDILAKQAPAELPTAAAPGVTNLSTHAAILQDRLAKMKLRETELLTTYLDSSTPVQQLRAQIAEVERALESEPGAALTNRLVALVSERADLAGLRARIGVLQQQLADATDEARRLDEIASRIVQLERSRDIQEDNYRNFSRSLEQARINDVLDAAKISNISVVQPAMLVAVGYRRERLRACAIAAGGGLALGILVALLVDCLPGRRIHRTCDLSAGLRIPVLLSVPTAGNGTRRTAWRGAEDAEEGALPVVGALQPYCDALGDRLARVTGAGFDPLLVGLTSLSPGAGVTTLASGVALALARQYEARVLLMDPEPRSARGGRLPGLRSTSGALDIRADAAGNITVIEHNLFLLGPGGASGAPGSSSLVRRWPDLVELARAGGYRFLVLDLPPVSPVSAALRIAAQLHATVLVVQAERDRMRDVEQACELLSANRVRVAGAVLNRCPMRDVGAVETVHS
jgi:uncharacterized protein involved in exopolysaccharide biosynthesis